jgi:LysR family nitrogen assimilation transcriptional regulator
MDLKQLTALVTVADLGSVTRAAAYLHLGQPAVTRQIRMLEDEVGTPLFERTRQGMVPTAAGELMVERARRALRELEQGRAEVGLGTDKVAGSVTIGLLESVTDVLLEPLFTTVTARYPGIDLRILTGYSGHLRQWLEDGDVDLALLYDVAGSLPVVLPLPAEALWVVGPPEAGLRPDEPVPWATALRCPLILPVAGHGLRVLIEKARAAVPHELDLVAETNSMHIQKSLVLSGSGWTILPAIGVAGDVRQGVLSGAPLCEPTVSRSLVLGRRLGGGRTPPAVTAVASGLVELIERLVGDGRWTVGPG